MVETVAREQVVVKTGLLGTDHEGKDENNLIKESFAAEDPVPDAEVLPHFRGPVQGKRLEKESRSEGGRNGLVWLCRRLTHEVHDANDEHFGFDLFDRRPIDLWHAELSPQASYDSHIDMAYRSVRFADRKISQILLLSGPDEYGGGLIRVGGEALSAPDQRAAGTLIMFPSYCQWSIGSVTSGKLTLMVGWYEGPLWR